MALVKAKIDNVEVTVPEGTTILEAAKQIGIKIPTLCYLKDINEIGACRVCVVEVNRGKLQTSCTYPVYDGMDVRTNSKRVRQARKTIVELILASHNRECTTCVRNNNCELQALAADLGIDDIEFESYEKVKTVDDFSTSIVRDESKCILCRRCVAVCNNVQTVGVLSNANRSFETRVTTEYNKPLSETNCINCGQCIINCPVGALREKNNVDLVWDAINDETKHVVVQTAPAVRAALGEEFGLPIGTRVTGKMVAAIRRLGFDKTFDTDFAADLTIMEEGTELLGRLKNGGTLPMITSCSPGWIKFCEHNYPELLDHVSSCKSPQNMMGAILKSHYAEKNNIDLKDMVVVSIMPCTAKKFEIQREELKVNGVSDVDISITTRELAQMIKQAGIKFTELEDESFDEYFGDSTGAAVIFGATGGVMEAAVRTLADLLNDKDLEQFEYKAVRGLEGIKEAEIDITDDLKVKVAVASGGANLRKIMELIKEGKADYHFIEFMACPGGCLNGGGQPIVSSQIKNETDIRKERMKAIYDEDANMPIRKSHKNPSIKRLYDEFLGEPNSHKAHELLHTHYIERG